MTVVPYLGNFKLAQKGLVLICLPLLLQIVFFAIYNDLFSQSENTAKKESKTKNVIGRSNWIGNLVLIYSLGTAAQSNGLTSDLDGAIDDSILASRSSFKELAFVLKDDAAKHAIVEDAIQVNEDLIKAVNAIRHNKVISPASNPNPLLKTAVKPLLQRLSNLRHALLAGESKCEGSNMSAGASIRERKRDFIFAAIIFDVFLAVLAFCLFTRQITHRLDVLVKNNDLFAQHQALNPPLPGKDEVAQLDRSFHLMAEQIRQVEVRKQEYLQMMSHDMRTPLASVRCCFDLMTLPEFGVSSEGLQRLKNAEYELTRVLNMINTMLEIERCESGAQDFQKETEQVSEIVKEAVQSVFPLAEAANIKLEVLDSPPASVPVDHGEIVRVVTNLVANAVKYSPEQTKIAISWIAGESGSIKIQVKDQGRGIPQECLTSVFERFKQVETTDRCSGKGLGLSICKAIVAAHNGRIGAESIPGQGSLFWFELPLA